VVFGAGGRAGRALVHEALRRSHPVTGVVRDPRRHDDLAGQELRMVAGDVTDPTCAPAVAGNVRALINAVTPFSAPPESFDDFDSSYYVRLAEILAAAAGTSRVIEIGLAATLRTDGGRLYEDDRLFPSFLRPFAEARMRGIDAWRQQSGGTDWLIVTPPPNLSIDAPVTGRYRLADDTLDPAAANAPLSYADLAVAVLDEIESPTRHREQVAVYADAVGNATSSA
jgi:putative NADH-flavin reductase